MRSGELTIDALIEAGDKLSVQWNSNKMLRRSFEIL